MTHGINGNGTEILNENENIKKALNKEIFDIKEAERKRNREERNEKKKECFEEMGENRTPRDDINDVTLTRGSNIDLIHDSSGTGTGKTSSHNGGIIDDIGISNLNKKNDREKWRQTFITSIYATHTVKQAMDTSKDAPVLKKLMENFNKTGVGTPIIHLPANDTLLMAWMNVASVINKKQITSDYNLYGIDRISILEYLKNNNNFKNTIEFFRKRKNEKKKKKDEIPKKEYSVTDLCGELNKLKTLRINNEDNEGENDDVEYDVDESEFGVKKNFCQKIVDNISLVCISDLGLFKGHKNIIDYNHLKKEVDEEHQDDTEKEKKKKHLTKDLFGTSKEIFNDIFTGIFKNENLFVINKKTGSLEINKDADISEKEAFMLFIFCFKPTIISQFVDSLILTTHSKLITETCFKFINLPKRIISSCSLNCLLGGFNIVKNENLMSSLVESDNTDIKDKLYNAVGIINTFYEEKSNIDRFFPKVDPYNNKTQNHRVIFDESPCFIEKLFSFLSLELIKNNENLSDISQSINEMFSLDDKIKNSGIELPEPNGNPSIRIEHLRLSAYNEMIKHVSKFIESSIKINRDDNREVTIEEVKEDLEILKNYFMSSSEMDGAMSLASYGNMIIPELDNEEVKELKISSSTNRKNFELCQANIANAIRGVHKESIIPYTMTPESDNRLYFIVSSMGKLGKVVKCSFIKSQLDRMTLDKDVKEKIKYNKPFKGEIRYRSINKDNEASKDIFTEEVYAIPYTYYTAMIIFSVIYPAKISNDVMSDKEDSVQKGEWRKIRPHKDKDKETRDYYYDSRDTVLAEADRYLECETSPYIEQSAKYFFQDIDKQNSDRTVSLYQAHLYPLILNDFNINVDVNKESPDANNIIINLLLQSNIKILSPAIYIWFMSKMPLSQLVMLSATTGFKGIYANEIINDYRTFQNKLKQSSKNKEKNLYRDGLYVLDTKKASSTKEKLDKVKMRNADTNELCPPTINSAIVGSNRSLKDKDKLFHLDYYFQKSITVNEIPEYVNGEPDLFNEEYHNNRNKISKTYREHGDIDKNDFKKGLLFSENNVADGRKKEFWNLNELTNGIMSMNNIFDVLSKKKDSLDKYWKDLLNKLQNITTSQTSFSFHEYRYNEFLNACSALSDSIIKKKHQYIASRSDNPSKILLSYTYAMFQDLNQKGSGNTKNVDILRKKTKELKNGSKERIIIDTLIEFYDMNCDWYNDNDKKIDPDIKKLSVVVPPRMIFDLTDSELKAFNQEYPDGILIVSFIASKCKNSDTQVELFRIKEKKKFLVNTMSSFNNAQGFNLQVKVYCRETNEYIDEDYGIMSFISDQHYSNVGPFLTERSRMFKVAEGNNEKDELNKVVFVADTIMRGAYDNELNWSAVKGYNQKEFLEIILYREHIADILKKIMQSYGRAERSDRTKPIDINFYTYENDKNENLYDNASIGFLFFINDEIGFLGKSRYLESDIVPFASTLTTVLMTAFIHDNFEQIIEYRKSSENKEDVKDIIALSYKELRDASNRLWGGKDNTFESLMKEGREINPSDSEEDEIKRKHILRLALEIRNVSPSKINIKDNSANVIISFYDKSIKRIERLCQTEPSLKSVCENYGVIDDLKIMRDSTKVLNLSRKTIFQNNNGDGSSFTSSIPLMKNTVVLKNNIDHEIKKMIDSMTDNTKNKLTEKALNSLREDYKFFVKTSNFYMDEYTKNYLRGNIGERLFKEVLSSSDIDFSDWYEIETCKENVKSDEIWTGDYSLRKMNKSSDSDDDKFIIDGKYVRNAYERADILFYSPSRNKLIAFDVKNYRFPWENFILSEQRIEVKKESIMKYFGPQLDIFRKSLSDNESHEEGEMEFELKVVNVNPNKENRNYINKNLISLWSSSAVKDKEDFRETIALNNEIRLSFI